MSQNLKDAPHNLEVYCPGSMQLTPETIDELVGSAEHWAEALVALYKFVYRDVWDRIEKQVSWPIVSKDTWGYICDALIRKDHETNKYSVAAGWFWMDKGFTHRPSVPDWVVEGGPVLLSS